jgi:hypothetical protein
VLDTASGSQVANSPNRVFCIGFNFRDYTASTHKAIIKDGVRNVTVAELIGNAGLTPVDLNWQFPGQQIQKLILSQLDSGVLEVYLR